MATGQRKESLNRNFYVSEIRTIMILNESGNGIIIKFSGPRKTKKNGILPTLKTQEVKDLSTIN